MTERPGDGKKRVPAFGHGYRRTAAEAPHQCPVCERTYIPDEQAVELDGSGPLLMQLGDLCLKGGDGWLRAYYHNQEVVVCAE